MRKREREKKNLCLVKVEEKLKKFKYCKKYLKLFSDLKQINQFKFKKKLIFASLKYLVF